MNRILNNDQNSFGNVYITFCRTPLLQKLSMFAKTEKVSVDEILFICVACYVKYKSRVGLFDSSLSPGVIRRTAILFFKKARLIHKNIQERVSIYQIES